MVRRYTKLDMYDYRVEELAYGYTDIVIKIDSAVDVTIADIASEVTASDGYIYVEGGYYKLSNMHVDPTELHIITRNIHN